MGVTMAMAATQNQRDDEQLAVDGQYVSKSHPLDARIKSPAMAFGIASTL